MNIYLLIEALSEEEREELRDYFLKTYAPIEKEIKYANFKRFTTKQFCDEIRDDLPPILASRIINALRSYEEIVPFVDMINKRDFLRYRNTGKKSWAILEPMLKRSLDKNSVA